MVVEKPTTPSQEKQTSAIIEETPQKTVEGVET